MRSAHNTGTDGTQYDDTGNLILRTDARNVTTTYGGLNEQQVCTSSVGYSTSAGYDALNRPGCRSYSDSTPVVTLTYDTNLTISDPSGQFPEVSSTNYPKGRLVRASNSVSNTTYRYDAVGRVRSSAQATDSQTYLFGYSYNLFGMTAMRYPSTRLLSYGYDAAGRVNQVGSYATGIQYTAHGAVSQMTLGNGVVETTNYNSRLQTISIASGTLFQIGYGYGTTASSNNGNLISQTITAAGQTFNQTYTYDQFNRVASAAEGSNWTRAFGYDRWGNMWVVSGSGVPIDSFTARDASAYNAQNRRTDVGYDAAGNQTAIGGYTWAYDAEGHLKTSTINGASATYYYDGEGRRVKRVLPAGTTVYVYDASGDLAAEYGYAEPGGRCTTCYLTADHLGSTRMLADGTGVLKSLHDYLPFGEEVQAGVGGRSSTYYPAQPLAMNDGTTIKFTGKEREGENGAWLDYFGARYYASWQARFTSPDPLFVAEERITDPQQWNMYAYARNNPLKLIDPTGLGPTCGFQTEYCKEPYTGGLDAKAKEKKKKEKKPEKQTPKQPEHDPPKQVPADPTNPSRSLYQNELVQKKSDSAWMKTQNGKARGELAEAGFAVEYKDGKLWTAYETDNVYGSGKPNELKITIDEYTIAIVHTHGNKARPTPSPGDKTSPVPNYVRSQREVYVTVPGTDKVIQLIPEPK